MHVQVMSALVLKADPLKGAVRRSAVAAPTPRQPAGIISRLWSRLRSLWVH